MLPLASAGFHVIAPDQRGYGRTIGWDAAYDGDLRSFRLLNIARDALGLVAALGYRSVAAIVGHDFGSPVAAWCALVRPDVFQSVVLMSAPFPGPPSLPFNTASGATDSRVKSASSGVGVHEQLARLDPPRKHYQWYYSTREANADMHDAPQGIHDFLRAYYHYKSADWARNNPVPLKSFTAGELAKLPTYYIMELHKGMAATVAPEMPSPAEIASCRWLTEQELKVYSTEYLRTGFQGGLNWYRCRTQNVDTAELEFFSGRQIEVPSLFIAGRKDWGIYQVPGSIERMQHSACTHMRSCILVEGAGHWVQQEQPQQVSELLLEFLR
jgi:pimeloyl-ACP methyl ester carboxylesterase